MRNNVRVNDVPKNPVTRAAKMARLPIGLAGRTALGVGKRIGGRPAEMVAQEIQQRTADQIFRVLGELKGGAMKLGQALSIFEAAMPPEIAGPYRATLTKLQESAPPLPARTVHQVLARELGEDWRDNFAEFNDTPAAAASIGQVHQAVWSDGQRVAVKIQYPGAGRALIGDFNQLSRAGRLFGLLMPGLDVKPLLDELKDRVTEELNYELEAMSQQMFADAYEGDPDIYVPNVVMATEQVLVSEWMDGTPLSKIISDGSKEERDRAGILLVRFLFSGPSRAGLLHADPHPGNFRLLDDGRLGVLDFGAVDRLPGGLPPFFGRLLRIMHDDDADIEEVERELRANGFLRPGIDVDLDALHAFLAPLAEPSKVDCFKFSREWLREEATRVTDLRASNISRKFNVPPSYVLIHRVSTAGIGVLCQLECEGEFRAEVLRWIPGYFDPAPAGALNAWLASEVTLRTTARERPAPASGPRKRPAGARSRRGGQACGQVTGGEDLAGFPRGDGVGGRHAVVARGLQQPLADRGGRGRPRGEPGRERACLLEEDRRGQDPVHDPPLVHLGGRVDVAGHHQLGGPGDAGLGDQPLRAAAAGGEADGRLDQAERGVLGRPHQVTAQAQLEPDGEVQGVHHRDRGHRHPLQGLHQEARHQGGPLGRPEPLELVHVDATAEHLALGPEQHRAGRSVANQRGHLVEGRFQIGGQLAVEQVERRRRDHQLGHITGPRHVNLGHALLLRTR